MSDRDIKPDTTSDPKRDPLIVHSDNKQVLVRIARGMEFKAAITHTERDGEHQVVVASDKEHVPLLRMCVGGIMKLLAKEYSLPMNHLSYYERGMNGAMFQVDVEQIGNHHVSQGRWTEEAQVLEWQHPVGMPEVEHEIDLAQESLPPTPDLREKAHTEFLRARFQRQRL